MSGSQQVTNPTIVFNEIPYQARVPGTSIEVRPNYAGIGLVDFPASLLVIGQMLTGGSATPDEPQLIWQASQATSLFGAGSVAEAMVKTALAAAPTMMITAIGVADAAGATKAAGTLTLSGTATAAGTIALYVDGIRIAVPVAEGDSLSAIGTAVGAAATTVNQGRRTLPVTVGAPTGTTTVTVALTARHGGLLGNEIDLRLNLLPGDATPPGLTVTLSAMASGATSPTIENAIANIAADWYTDIAIAWTDATNLGLLTAELTRRYGAMVRLDATGYVAFTGSVGTLATAGAGAGNCPYLVAAGLSKPVSSPWIIAASLAAVACFNLTNDPARQLRGLVLPGVIGSAAADRFTAWPDENSLLYDGIAVLRTRADMSVICERIITTYLTNAEGVADSAWLDVMVPKVMTRIRYDWRSYVELVYPRNKLADDGTLAAQYDTSIVTPKRMKASWAGRSKLYEQYGWIEHAAESAASSLFTRDTSDRNRLNARQQVRIIGNLMILDGVLEFAA